MLDRIKEMRRFLRACEITGYMTDDQIELLLIALDALEKEVE